MMIMLARIMIPLIPFFVCLGRKRFDSVDVAFFVAVVMVGMSGQVAWMALLVPLHFLLIYLVAVAKQTKIGQEIDQRSPNHKGESP